MGAVSAPGRGVAVVSGAGSGIGRAIALALAERGHRLALIGRRREPLAVTLEAAGTEGRIRALDVREDVRLAEAASSIDDELGPTEVVVAAAGMARVGEFELLPAADFRDSIEVNLIGTANLFRAFLPGLRARGRGTLVALLSVAARRTFPGWSAYAASKWGLLGLVESLREELVGSGVRMLALTPGATATELWSGVPGEWPRERMIPVEEVARALVWALDGEERVAVDEIRLQPPGGNL
jgi:3-oxoacyl-[acyl-carrier protein] reductase